MADRRDKRPLAPIGLGIELGAAVGLGVVLGQWADRQLGTAPWALVIGATVGVAGGLYHLVRSAQRSWRRLGDGSASRRDADTGERNDAD